MRKFIAIAWLTILAGARLPAVTHYNQSFTNQTEVAISYSSHGIASQYIAVRVYSEAGALQPSSLYSYTIGGASSYTVTITFSPAYTGSVKLSGSFGPPDSSNSYDFKATLSGENAVVCSGCGFENITRRSYSGKIYVALETHGGYVHSIGACTLRVYVEDNKVIYGLSAASSSCNGSCTGNCQVQYSISDYPSGVLKIARITTDSSSPKLSDVIDDRPFGN
jgi:hypothetical protein